MPIRAVTRGRRHHWFGYYDKSPEDRSGRYVLAHASDFAGRQPMPGEAVEVGLVDLGGGGTFVPLATTAAWSWQQGAQLQWLGPTFDREIIFNTWERGQHAAAILDTRTLQTRHLPLTVYGVAPDGTQAVTTDYVRLHHLRPGYGYATGSAPITIARSPNHGGIWRLDLRSGDHALILSVRQLAIRRSDRRMLGATHVLEHMTFNPGGTRFAFLHRWRRGGEGWFARVYTARLDGGDLRAHLDSGYASHYDWRDDDVLLIWGAMPPSRSRDLSGASARGFFTLDVRTNEVVPVGLGTLTEDGHCSYSPDRRWILMDNYPDRAGMQRLVLYEVDTRRRYDLMPEFFSPAGFRGPVRCDLHPRWSRDGTRVYFDGCHETQRQVYVADVSTVVGV